LYQETKKKKNMKTLKFKTDIKCSGCLARVMPHLNNLAGKNTWRVDLLNPEKTLTVESNEIDSIEIIETINKAGFKAELL